MSEFTVGDFVRIKNKAENISRAVDCATDQTGKHADKVEQTGYVPPEDLGFQAKEKLKAKAKKIK